MAKLIPRDDGKRTVALVSEAERLAGETERREQAAAARARTEALRLANEAAARLVEAERTAGRKHGPK